MNVANEALVSAVTSRFICGRCNLLSSLYYICYLSYPLYLLYSFYCSIFFLLSSIFYLLSSIFYLPSSIFFLLSFFFSFSYLLSTLSQINTYSYCRLFTYYYTICHSIISRTQPILIFHPNPTIDLYIAHLAYTIPPQISTSTYSYSILCSSITPRFIFHFYHLSPIPKALH